MVKLNFFTPSAKELLQPIIGIRYDLIIDTEDLPASQGSLRIPHSVEHSKLNIFGINLSQEKLLRQLQIMIFWEGEEGLLSFPP